jgi:hypothetical protein
MHRTWHRDGRCGSRAGSDGEEASRRRNQSDRVAVTFDVGVKIFVGAVPDAFDGSLMVTSSIDLT